MIPNSLNSNKNKPKAYLSNDLGSLVKRLKDNLHKTKKHLLLVPSIGYTTFLLESLRAEGASINYIKIMPISTGMEHINTLLYPKKIFPNREAITTLIYEKLTSATRKWDAACELATQFEIYRSESVKTNDEWQEKLWEVCKEKWWKSEEMILPISSYQIDLFDITYISKRDMDLLRFISKHWQINYYFRSPSPHFWGDRGAESPQIERLISFGRRLFNQLVEMDYSAEYRSYGQTRVLNSFKNHLLALKTLPSDIDESFSIHRAPTKLREIEVLLHKIHTLPIHPIKKSDVLVLAPKIDEYLQHIEATFDIGYSIENIPSLRSNSNMELIKTFWELPVNDFSANDILKLTESTTFKSSLSNDDRYFLKELCKKFNLVERDLLKDRWKILDYLLDRLHESTSPISSADLEELGKCITFIKNLLESFKALPEYATPNTWAKLISELLEGYFTKTTSRDALLRISTKTLKYLKGENLSRKSIFHMMISNMQSCKETLISEDGIITFANLTMGRIADAKAIFLIGMSGDKFPRSLPKMPFDNRPPIQDYKDNYLILQALLSAKDHLKVIYSIPPESNKNVSGIIHDISNKEIEESLLSFQGSYYSDDDFQKARDFYQKSPKTKETIEKEEPSNIPLSELIELANNPLRLFCKHLGVKVPYDNVDNFQFVTPKRIISTLLPMTFDRNFEEVIDIAIKEQLLPLSPIGDRVAEEIVKTLKKIRTKICKKPTHALLPKIDIGDMQKLEIYNKVIYGKIDGIVEEAMFIEDSSRRVIWEYIPQILCYTLLRKKNSLKLLTPNRDLYVTIDNNKEALRDYISYYKEAIKKPISKESRGPFVNFLKLYDFKIESTKAKSYERSIWTHIEIDFF